MELVLILKCKESIFTLLSAAKIINNEYFCKFSNNKIIKSGKKIKKSRLFGTFGNYI